MLGQSLLGAVLLENKFGATQQRRSRRRTADTATSCTARQLPSAARHHSMPQLPRCVERWLPNGLRAARRMG